MGKITYKDAIAWIKYATGELLGEPIITVGGDEVAKVAKLVNEQIEIISGNDPISVERIRSSFKKISDALYYVAEKIHKHESFRQTNNFIDHINELRQSSLQAIKAINVNVITWFSAYNQVTKFILAMNEYCQTYDAITKQ